MDNLPKGLFGQYTGIKESYYRISIDVNSFFGANHKENLIKARCFIREHLEKGNKNEVHKIPWIEELRRSNKHIHVVSLYLLGLTLQENLSEFIRQDIERFISNPNWYDYKYTWFLTCLYHDIASNIEHGKIPENPSEQQKQLTYYLGDNNISYTIFNSKWRQYAYQPRFSESLVQNYFYYRASIGECDHGILGGYYLFDRLYKNYQKNTINGHSIDGLTRRESHLPHFSYICDAIICHNIWTQQSFDVPEDERFKNEEDIETYKDFGLSPLIYRSKKERLKFEEYPLQFLLCLLDTLEPVKRFNGECRDALPSAKEILSSIDIKIYNSGNRQYKFNLVIHWDDVVNNWNGFKRWERGILNTPKWLYLTVNEKHEGNSANSIIISF